MSLLTQRAALRLQLAEIDATPCAACGDRLDAHSLIRTDGRSNIPPCRGSYAGEGNYKRCKCKGWVETTDVQTALKV